MDDLDDPLKLLPVECLDSFAEIFLLLEGKHVVIGDLGLL